jgi:hypothetical protein
VLENFVFGKKGKRLDPKIGNPNRLFNRCLIGILSVDYEQVVHTFDRNRLLKNHLSRRNFL